MDLPILTFDVDWAPDFVIDFVAERLIASQVRSTWFVTHISPAIERLRQYPELFELGIHPNFLPNSTHGTSIDGILSHCMDLVPEATSMRTHGLAWSSQIFARILQDTPIEVDVSIFLPYQNHVTPVLFRYGDQALWRIPYFWEDDIEMYNPVPEWSLAKLTRSIVGLRIFDFHPIHLYLNSADMTAYERLKQRISVLLDTKPDTALDLVNHNIGARNVFEEIVNELAVRGQSYRIKDIVAAWTSIH